GEKSGRALDSFRRGCGRGPRKSSSRRDRGGGGGRGGTRKHDPSPISTDDPARPGPPPSPREAPRHLGGHRPVLCLPDRRRPDPAPGLPERRSGATGGLRGHLVVVPGVVDHGAPRRRAGHPDPDGVGRVCVGGLSGGDAGAVG
ncbi:unnamed protein product, partial [Scytosiphon promiscuus]